MMSGVDSSRQTIAQAIGWLHVALILYRANAQTHTPENSYGLYNTFDPAMAIVVVILVGAFFAIGLVSFYLRQCAEVAASAGSGNISLDVSRSRRRGLNRDVVETFPVFLYSSVKELRVGKGSLECAVCLSEFDDDETLRLLPKCSHVFHLGCIDAWLASHTTCPVCRAELKPESGKVCKDAAQYPSVESDAESSHVEARAVNESENHVAINVNQDETSELPAGEIKPTVKQNLPVMPGMSWKFPRSHSTGHSLGQLGESTEIYTLRLSDEAMKLVVAKVKLKRTMSYDVVLAAEGSSTKGNCRTGGEYPHRWVFSMTPPFVSKSVNVKFPKTFVAGDAEYSTSSNVRTALTSVNVPLNCLNLKVEQGESSSGRLPV